MIKGDYDKLKDLAKYNMCAEHHSPVVVAWYGPEKCWTLLCGEDHYPDILTRQLSLTQEYKAGANIPEPVKSNIEKGMRRRQMQQGKQVIPFELEGVPNKDLATGELLYPEQVKSLIDYAYKYHLDPYRGHVVLMYGKPYIGIDGYLYHAWQLNVAYSLTSRPMTTVEAKIFKIGKLDHGWIGTVTYLADGATFTGTGIVTYEEMTAKSPRDATKLRSPVVAAHPWQLAQKRCEWQAMRRAFPIGESREPISSPLTTP